MILDEIVARKQRVVARAREETPLADLIALIAGRQPPLDFGKALKGGMRLIAEVKKASPSKGVLCRDFDPVALAKAYARAGASAISVMTESDYFMGSLEDLAAIRREVNVPLLRKDFIFDPYQVYESAAYGADALLLIASILDDARLKQLLSVARTLGLSCLVEVHNEVELERALLSKARIIGINNRDLGTFKVDIETSKKLRPLIPKRRTVVSESGISSSGDVDALKKCGVNAVLVGEALVTAPDVSRKIRELIA